MKRFRMKATDFSRQRVLSWRMVVVLMLSGHKVSRQNALNKFFRALGQVWRVVTASAYRQARQKVQPDFAAMLRKLEWTVETRKVMVFPGGDAAPIRRLEIDIKDPQDVLATMYHHLGIDVAAQYEDHSGRPHPVLPSGTIISELL